MAENKTGPNLQAGAGFLAKRVQKSFNRAQEKVTQKTNNVVFSVFDNSRGREQSNLLIFNIFKETKCVSLAPFPVSFFWKIKSVDL